MKMNNYIQKIKQAWQAFLKDPLFLRQWEWSYYSAERGNNRLSVRVMWNRGERSYRYNGDSFMFIEDMYTGIMPFMIYSGEREKYPAKVEPSSQGKERLVADGISGRGYRSFLGDSLCDFVRMTTHTLVQYGEVLYEIVYKAKSSGEIESFKLEFVESTYLFRFFKNYYQFIPWWVARESHTRVRIIKIPAEKILKIVFPKDMGGKSKIQKILKRLWQLSKELIPNFQMDAMGKNINIGFDLNEFSRVKYLEVAELTKSLGWSQRQLSGDYITEYYSILRFLRQKKLEATLRKHIISSLNKALNRAPLNIGVNVSMENLFTIEDVERQIKILESGNVNFMDVLNALKV